MFIFKKSVPTVTLCSTLCWWVTWLLRLKSRRGLQGAASPSSDAAACLSRIWSRFFLSASEGSDMVFKDKSLQRNGIGLSCWLLRQLIRNFDENMFVGSPLCLLVAAWEWISRWEARWHSRAYCGGAVGHRDTGAGAVAVFREMRFSNVALLG